MTPEDLKALGVETETTAAENAFARVLLLGPAKAGKTTCIASTAPKPLIINCDGASATKGPRNLGAKFLTVEAYNRKDLKRALEAAKKLVAAGEVRTVLLDTITLLGENLIDEMSITLSGYDLFREYGKIMTGAIRTLMALDAHLFVIGHFAPRGEFEQGVMPSIPGQAKIKIPAMLDDWIAIDFDPKRNPPRQFLVGAQGSWSAGGRNIRRSTTIPADVPALFKELGIQP